MGSPQKTTLFGSNRTSRKVRFVELSSCTSTRRGFADVCRPRGRWGFREVLVHVSLALLMALMGRTMMTNTHILLQEESQANHVLLIFDVYKMWSTSIFSLPDFRRRFFFKEGMVVTLDEFCGQCNSHPWNPWATQWVLSTTGECFRCHIGLVIPCYLKQRLFVKMLAYYGPPRKEGTLLLASCFKCTWNKQETHLYLICIQSIDIYIQYMYNI